MTHSFYAHGKLLLSGEYLVLKGALSLAIPCRFGQRLDFTSKTTEQLSWHSFDEKGRPWFKAIFGPGFEVNSCSDPAKATFLQQLLTTAAGLSEKDFPYGEVETRLEFARDWGLGSSSTLTYLVASLFDIDPFDLFFRTQNGSGYDIACAGSDQGVFYQLQHGAPQVTTTTLPEVFEEVYFIHLNQKQLSAPEVSRFRGRSVTEGTLQQISEISLKLSKVSSVTTLQNLVKQHEDIISEVLERPAIQGLLFPDFTGTVKSLGAWGGDFVMAVGKDTRDYFFKKGYPDILTFREMSLC